MSTLTTLHFYKKDDKTCTILMRLQAQNREIGIELQENPEAIPSTALAFLLELLEVNKTHSNLQKLLQKDLNLDESARTPAGSLLSDYFINYETTMKYVRSAKIVHIREELLFCDTVPNIGLSKQEEDVFWGNIMRKTQHNFYLPDEDDFEEGAEMPRYCGNMNVLQNLEILETFLSLEQINKIWPCMEFEIIFHENYLQGIDNLNSVESTSDAFIYQWLTKI